MNKCTQQEKFITTEEKKFMSAQKMTASWFGDASFNISLASLLYATYHVVLISLDQPFFEKL